MVVVVMTAVVMASHFLFKNCNMSTAGATEIYIIIAAAAAAASIISAWKPLCAGGNVTRFLLATSR